MPPLLISNQHYFCSSIQSGPPHRVRSVDRLWSVPELDPNQLPHEPNYFSHNHLTRRHTVICTQANAAQRRMLSWYSPSFHTVHRPTLPLSQRHPAVETTGQLSANPSANADTSPHTVQRPSLNVSKCRQSAQPSIPHAPTHAPAFATTLV